MPVNIRIEDGGAVVNVTGEVATPDGTVPDFESLLGDARQVDVYIDSFGGCSSIAYPLYEALKKREATAHILNRCFSAGAIIAAGCNRVLMARNGSFMVHHGLRSCFGNRQKMLRTAEEMKDSEEQDVRIFSARTGATHEKVRQWLAADSFFTSEGALRAGFVDELFDVPESVVIGGAVPSSEVPETCDESKAQLLMHCLDTIGQIETADRDKFFKDVHHWLLMNTKQFAPLPPSSSAGQNAGADAARSEASPLLAA